MASKEPSDGMASKPPVVCVFCASQPGRNPLHLESARSLARALHASKTNLVYGGGTVGIMGELARTLVSLSGPSAVHGVIPRALIKTEKGYDGTAVGQEGVTAAAAGGKAAEKIVSEEALQQLSDNASVRAAALAAGKPHNDLLNGVLKESEFGLTTVVQDMHTRKRLMANMVINGGPGSGFVALAGGYGTIEEVMEMVTWNQLGIHKMPIVLVNIDGYWDGLLKWVQNAVDEGYVGQANQGILVEVKSADEVEGALRAYRLSKARYELNWN